ncbi:MAG: hypothetical protein ABSD28_19785 [Tepidisphaeraceae bacterium]|jgi:hypothetical protein
MATNKEQVLKLQSEQSKIHDAYKAALTTYRDLDKQKTPAQELRKKLQAVRDEGSRYFNHCEQFVANSNLLGAHVNEAWATNLAEDCYSLLKALIGHNDAMKAWSAKLGVLYSPPEDTAFAGMQRMVVSYLPKEKTAELLALYEKHALPKYGFNNPLPTKKDGDMSPGKQRDGDAQPPKSIARWVAGVVAVSTGAATIYGLYADKRIAILAFICMVFAIILLLVVQRAIRSVGTPSSQFYDIIVKVLVIFVLLYFMAIAIVLFPVLRNWLSKT